MSKEDRREKFTQPVSVVEVVIENYKDISEAIHTANSLEDMRNIYKHLDDVKGQERADVGELFMMQWRIFGGSFEELERMAK